MYVVLGATGHIGSVIAASLLRNGEKVRVVGREASRLERFTRKGAQPFPANAMEPGALTHALTGARAAFLMIPPGLSSQDYAADQDRTSDAIAESVNESGLRYAVNLSSYGAQAVEGTGPIARLRSAEQKLNEVHGLNVLHLRPGYFMENNLAAIGMIQGMGIFGNALQPDLKLPMIATCDIGDYAAQRLLKLDFNGQETRELLGPRDLSMTEVTAIIARGLGKPDLRYVQFPYEQVQQVLVQMGIPVKTAGQFIEMYKGMNERRVVNQEARSAENSTPTTFEKFVQDIFAPAYHGKAATA
jgi:uncharacterized protein YbjT (DUF2867 family)